MKHDHTVNERQRRQTLRDRSGGIVRVTVKVPKDAADMIRQLAASIRLGRQLARPFTPEDDVS